MNLSQTAYRDEGVPKTVNGGLPQPPIFATVKEERQHRKERLAAGFRLFSKFGFDEGVVGHITARDPEFTDTFWVNSFGMSFGQIRASDLIRVNHHGHVVEGDRPVNAAAFAIHSCIHTARPDSVGAAHAHSTYGRAFASMGRKLSAVTQDACAFYNDHALYEDYGGVADDLNEGQQIALALGAHKAAILQNHGLLTVGRTVDEALWWFITMERSCQVQLLAEGAAALTGNPLKVISDEAAEKAFSVVGTPFMGWFSFQPLYSKIVREQPDLLE